MKRFVPLLFLLSLFLLLLPSACSTDGGDDDALAAVVLSQEQRDYAASLGKSIENRRIVCRCDMGDYLLYATIPLSDGVVRPNSTTLYEFFSDYERYESAAVEAQTLRGIPLASYSFYDDLMLIVETGRNLLGPLSYEEACKTLTKNNTYRILR